jgi:hypothetical protein
VTTGPASVTDLPHSEFCNETPQTFTFRDDQRGKTVWFCCRWETTNNKKGPWGELMSAIIP